MNTEFPLFFISIWGFLGIAFIYFIDGLIEYRVRSKEYPGDTLKNRFLFSHLFWRNKPSTKKPSIFYNLLLLIPGTLAFFISISMLPNLPKIGAAIALALFFLLTWLFSSRISQDFLSAVFLSFAIGLFVIIIARIIFLKQLIAVGFRPEEFLSLYLLVALLLYSRYFNYLLPKFMPNYRWKYIKVFAWEHLIQIILLAVWLSGLFVALFPRELFR